MTHLLRLDSLRFVGRGAKEFSLKGVLTELWKKMVGRILPRFPSGLVRSVARSTWFVMTDGYKPVKLSPVDSILYEGVVHYHLGGSKWLQLSRSGDPFKCTGSHPRDNYW